MKPIFFLKLVLSATLIQAQTFYLDENGVTIKCLDCQPGDLGIVDGVVYTAVDNEMLYDLAVDYEAHDFSVLCTTLATDLSELFSSKSNFNDDISSWDVSNVEDMGQMFRS
ncbi:MAG: BspA family leucine-rich repeat surface protein, partial [Flavobacteriales bacterium]|nr:BspA family leucine-rich repeat surface protein [Flavobacteriales bacterium]